MKMKTVYEANPALGDPMSIQVNILLVIEVKDSSRVLYQGQLTENGHRLDKLRSDLRRYQVRLENSCRNIEFLELFFIRLRKIESNYQACDHLPSCSNF